MAETRSRAERALAMTLDPIIRRVTPNTVYHNPRANPFTLLDDERDQIAGAAASRHLVELIEKAGRDRLFVEYSGLAVNGEDWGRWVVLVKRVPSKNCGNQ